MLIDQKVGVLHETHNIEKKPSFTFWILHRGLSAKRLSWMMWSHCRDFPMTKKLLSKKYAGSCVRDDTSHRVRFVGLSQGTEQKPQTRKHHDTMSPVIIFFLTTFTRRNTKPEIRNRPMEYPMSPTEEPEFPTALWMTTGRKIRD